MGKWRVELLKTVVLYSPPIPLDFSMKSDYNTSYMCLCVLDKDSIRQEAFYGRFYESGSETV